MDPPKRENPYLRQFAKEGYWGALPMPKFPWGRRNYPTPIHYMPLYNLLLEWYLPYWPAHLDLSALYWGDLKQMEEELPLAAQEKQHR